MICSFLCYFAALDKHRSCEVGRVSNFVVSIEPFVILVCGHFLQDPMVRTLAVFERFAKK